MPNTRRFGVSRCRGSGRALRAGLRRTGQGTNGSALSPHREQTEPAHRETSCRRTHL
nr:MAG TPA: hypothetical protein [Caudoviricetes sp.]